MPNDVPPDTRVDAVPGPVPSQPPLRTSQLATIAHRTAAMTVTGVDSEPLPLWQAVVRHDPAERLPVRLVATDRYEVWVIGWCTDQRTRLHDHGGSTGSLLVTEGELTELRPRRGSLASTRLQAGSARRFPVTAVHDVVNRNRQPATSIHVYSPPLTSMTYYDTAKLDPTGTTVVASEPPLLVSDGGLLPSPEIICA